MEFIINGGLPYLLKDGITYAVRWDDKGFTVGDPVSLPGLHTEIHSEIAVKAKCNTLNSIDPLESQTVTTTIDSEPDEQQEVTEPDEQKVQKGRRQRKKAV